MVINRGNMFSERFIRSLLILSGVVIAFVILELTLRLGGYAFSLRQDLQNEALFDETEFRILCIGESTTALGGEDSYPSQLEEILNEENRGIRFKVINKGLVSKTSFDILRHLDDYLASYRPHLVISMLGVNDQLMGVGDGPAGRKSGSTLDGMRTVKLIKWLGLRLKQLFRMETPGQASRHEPDSRGKCYIQEIHNKIDILKPLYEKLNERINGEQNVMRKAERSLECQGLKKQLAVLHLDAGQFYCLRGDFEQARENLVKALAFDKNNYWVLLSLGNCLKELKHDEEAILFLKRACQIVPGAEAPVIELGRIYDLADRKQEARVLYSRIAESDYKSFDIYYEAGQWLLNNGFYEKAETAFNKAIALNPENVGLNNSLSETYRCLKESQKQRFYAGKAQALRRRKSAYAEATVENYNEIADRVLSSGIRMICMQYPLRSIDDLKAVFGTDKNSLMFVENSSNFEAVLKKGRYADFFTDNFAGDFGHCTGKGNRLIARRLAETIMGTFSPAHQN